MDWATKRKIAKIKREKEAKRVQVQMLSDARASDSKLAVQQEKNYLEWKKAEERKDFKRAMWHFKMFVFMSKLKTLTERYVQVLEAQEAFAETLKMLNDTSRCFNRLMALSPATAAWRIKRNVRKFKKMIAKFDSVTDSVMAAIDGIFDDDSKKKKKNGGDSPSDEELYNAAMAQNIGFINTYETQHGLSQSEVSDVTGGSVTSGGASGATGGVADPNDF